MHAVNTLNCATRLVSARRVALQTGADMAAFFPQDYRINLLDISINYAYCAKKRKIGNSVITPYSL
jgi:hypothetical protein